MEGLAITWWMWCVLGLLLMLAESLTPGAFYQFFFGLGAIAVGLLGVAGLDLSLSVQISLFLVLSLASLALLRKPLRVRFTSGADEEVDKIEGETAVAFEDIAVDAIGKAELRGTVWNARNVGDAVIAKSQRCRVVRLEGLTLDVSGGELQTKSGG